MKKIYIYTDGACRGNPGPGGWGALIIEDGKEIEISGGQKKSTNNKMELTAVIEALKTIKKKSSLVITTDSEYVKKGITQWIKKWVVNNWQTVTKKPVKNQEYWKELLALTKKHDIEWKWVRGHAGHPENERCDELARNEIKKLFKK